MHRLLKIFASLYLLLFVAFTSTGQRRVVEPFKERPTLHDTKKISTALTVERAKEIIEKGNPFHKEKRYEDQIDEYVRAQRKLNDVRKDDVFNNNAKKTKELSEIKIFISRGEMRRTDKEYLNGDTRFCSNFGIKGEDLSPSVSNLDLKDCQYYFKSAFGEHKTEDVISNATFYFDYGIEIGEFEKEILSKSKKTYLFLPDGWKAKCEFIQEKNGIGGTLYFENRDHNLEQATTHERYFMYKAAIEHEAAFKNNFIISFINNDSKTQKAIEEKHKGNSVRISKPEELAELESILSLHKSDRIVLMGQIEDQGCVSRDLNQNVLFELSMGDINRLRAKYNLFLNTLGCNSIHNGSGLGYSKNIKSLQVMTAIYGAFQSKTHEDFFDALSIGDNKCFVKIAQLENQLVFEAAYKPKPVESSEPPHANTHEGLIEKAFVYSTLPVNNSITNSDKEKSSPEPETDPDYVSFGDVLFTIISIVAIFAFIMWILNNTFLKIK